MRYGITTQILGDTCFLEITKDEFEAAKAAKEHLLAALGIEEKLNLLLENYAEYEGELLRLTLHNVLFEDLEWSAFIGDIHEVNRRLVNLFTTFRLYIDQVQHNINTMYGRCSVNGQGIHQIIESEHTTNLGYRVIDALRNYVQHQSLPIYALAYSTELVDHHKTDGITKHVVTPKIKVCRLAEDNKFNAAVLKELRAIGDEVDIRPLARQCVESIGRIHLRVRDFIGKDSPDWENEISEIQRRYREASGGDVVGLVVAKYDECGSPAEMVEIFDGIIKRRRWLEGKNCKMANLATSVVTNEAELAQPTR